VQAEIASQGAALGHYERFCLHLRRKARERAERMYIAYMEQGCMRMLEAWHHAARTSARTLELVLRRALDIWAARTSAILGLRSLVRCPWLPGRGSRLAPCSLLGYCLLGYGYVASSHGEGAEGSRRLTLSTGVDGKARAVMMRQLLLRWAMQQRRAGEQREEIKDKALAALRQACRLARRARARARRLRRHTLLEWAVATRGTELGSLRLERHLEHAVASISHSVMVGRCVI